MLAPRLHEFDALIYLIVHIGRLIGANAGEHGATTAAIYNPRGRPYRGEKPAGGEHPRDRPYLTYVYIAERRLLSHVEDDEEDWTELANLLAPFKRPNLTQTLTFPGRIV